MTDRVDYGSRNAETGRRCTCGRPISKRATGCRFCRTYPVRSLEQRFWSHVVKGPGCWEWTAGRDSATGYGRIREGSGRSTPFLLTHRVSWELANGPIPDGMLVCHTCDNRPCVRPDHLFLGTAADNMRDAQIKGRMQRGDAWYRSRPTFKRRTDPVTSDVALLVLQRDSGCVAVTLGQDPSTCVGRLQLDHVRDEPMMGKRAPSDPRHLVSVCAYHHLGGWATSHRPELRAYLREVAA